MSLRRLCFLLSSPPNKNGFVGELKNFAETVTRETASRTRERSQNGSELQAVGRRSTPSVNLSKARKDRGWTAFRGNSDESKSQKAGAEQGDPTGSQGQEAVGNEISISHDTPSELSCSSELIKVFGTNPFERSDYTHHPRSGPRADTLERMGEEDSCTDQSHHRSHCLEHCRLPLRPERTCRKRRRACTVKNISGRVGTKREDRGFSATGVSKGCSETAAFARKSTGTARNHWFTTQTLSPFPPRSGCDIFTR